MLRSDDTSLHDIDLAINRVQQESDEDNIIWGVKKIRTQKKIQNFSNFN